MAKVKTLDLTRVNINLPTATVERVKEYARELGLPITQAYTILINNALNQKDTIDMLPRIFELAKEFKDKPIDLPNLDDLKADNKEV